MRRVITILFSLSLIIAACGDDDSSGNGGGSDSRDEIVAGLRSAITESQGPASEEDPFAIDDAEALCFASELVDDLGADRMANAITQDFEVFMAEATSQERRQVVDAMLGCIDVRDALADELGASGISADSAACVSDVMLGAEPFLDAVADSLAGGAEADFENPALVEALLPGMLQCLSAEELTNLGN